MSFPRDRVRRVPASAAMFVILLASPGPGQGPPAGFHAVSPEAADALGAKIATIQEAQTRSGRLPSQDRVAVSEIEMESFVLYWMRDEIPPRVESIDVTVTGDVISAVAELTFDEENRTGNPLVDTLFAGTHRFFASGALVGADGMGQFELREIRLDGFPVPLVVIDVLVSRFVNPRYPAVDLDEPFRIPWGIEEIRLGTGRADIRY